MNNKMETNKYITVAYKLYAIEDGEREFTEEATVEHPFQFISGLGLTLDAFESQIKGLDLQADDYITKPFSMPVLIRKIAAILRRTSKQEDTPHIMSYKDLTLDFTMS